MSMAEKIKIALIKRNMTLKELATRIGCTSQNFSEKELQEIASALDCSFEGRFISNDTGEEI